jgi:hypothetical protein
MRIWIRHRIRLLYQLRRESRDFFYISGHTGYSSLYNKKRKFVWYFKEKWLKHVIKTQPILSRSRIELYCFAKRTIWLGTLLRYLYSFFCRFSGLIWYLVSHQHGGSSSPGGERIRVSIQLGKSSALLCELIKGFPWKSLFYIRRNRNSD